MEEREEKRRMETLFAPAERSAWDEIERETSSIEEDAIVEMVMKAIPNIFVVLNPHRQIILANRVLAEAAGVENPAQVYGMRPGEVLDCIHADEMPGGCGTSSFCSSCGAVRAILRALDGVTNEDECQVLQKNSGKTLEFRVYATPFTQHSGRYVFFVINDIESEKRRKILEHVFFHDVMNTAGAIFNIAELLARTPPEEHPEFIPLLENSSKRLIDEVRAHRALLSAEHGELVPEFRPWSAGKIVRETVDLFRETAHSLRTAIETQIPEGEVTLKTDRLLLGRILGNLLKNAIEASRSGDTVRIGYTVESGETIRFFVHNAGVMPVSTKNQIFQRSFSTKGLGRGLGTYSVKLLGERFLGGRVWFVSSEEENGTTFYVEFLLNRASEPREIISR